MKSRIESLDMADIDMSVQQILKDKLFKIAKDQVEYKSNVEALFLFNVLEQNIGINLLEYRICYCPTYETTTDEYGYTMTHMGQKWWLEKIND